MITMRKLLMKEIYKCFFSGGLYFSRCTCTIKFFFIFSRNSLRGLSRVFMLALRFTVWTVQAGALAERELIFDAAMCALTLSPVAAAPPGSSKIVIMGGLLDASIRLPPDTTERSAF